MCSNWPVGTERLQLVGWIWMSTCERDIGNTPDGCKDTIQQQQERRTSSGMWKTLSALRVLDAGRSAASSFLVDSD